MISPVLESQEGYLQRSTEAELDDNNDTITASDGKCVCTGVYTCINALHVLMHCIRTCDYI